MVSEGAEGEGVMPVTEQHDPDHDDSHEHSAPQHGSGGP